MKNKISTIAIIILIIISECLCFYSMKLKSENEELKKEILEIEEVK